MSRGATGRKSKGGGAQGRSGHRRPWPHRFPAGYRSTVLLVVFVALLALVYGFYRVVPSASHANLRDRGAPVEVTRGPTTPTTTRSTTPAVAPATTTAPTTTLSTSTVPAGSPATSTTLAPKAETAPTVVPAPVVASGALALSASSTPTFDGSSIQVTVTAVLTRGGDGYGGQGVTYAGPGCSSASAVTASDGSATGVLTCTAASTIPITVSAAGKSVVTKVEA